MSKDTAVPRANLSRIASKLDGVGAIAKAMEARRLSRAAVKTGFVKARNATEEIVAGIWSALLRTENPGIHDNFFQLGGNSLLAVQVVSRVRQTLSVEMPLRAMFEAPTLSGFAQRIEEARRTQTGAAVPPLVKARRQGPVPASFAQQRLWFIDQLEPGNPIYNIPQMTRMRGPLNLAALEGSLHEIVRRHEMLRTTFHAVDGQPFQAIDPAVEPRLRITDLSALTEDERQGEVRRLAVEEAARPFDLAQGPVLRASLMRLGAQDHILLIVLHHIAGDRWSAGILAEEMEALYAAFARGGASPLPALAVQYSDFSEWQRGWLREEVLESQAAYWKRQLKGAPLLLELPTDRPRPAVMSHRGAILDRLLPKELIRKLTALSQSEGVTLFMTLLAALQMLLARYSGQEDMVTGSPIAGRNYTEAEPLIGFFVNTLALRTDLSGNPGFRELLRRVKETTLNAYAHQDIPFERLVEELQPERSRSHHPIFQVVFALQNAPQRALELAGLTLERLPLHQGTSAFDISWFATHVAEGMLLRVEYNTDLFDGTTIERAAGHFQNLLEAIVEEPGRPLAEFELLDEWERRHILLEFNDTAAEYPRGLCIHDLVTQQAHRSPEAIALIDCQQRLTYRELNARANQLAHYLIKRGAGPDVPVGVCGSRTADLLVAILGILKSGCAYVPLDPNYPRERLGYILEDSRAPLVLTRGLPAGVLPDFPGEAICLDEAWREIASESELELVTSVAPHHLGYVLFTSGSTGRPKGVAIEHRSAAAFIHWARQVFTAGELKGVLFSTSVCFDLSVFEIFVTLSAGGKVIVAENALHLPSLAARNEVTLINTVPSAIAELARMDGIPGSVSTVNLAGEALPGEIVEQIYAATKVEKVYNLYGPTEDTTYSTYTLVPRGAPVTIGRPVANTQAYILDQHKKIVPVGVGGELYLAGDGLARGYYGRPDLTAERFLSNPFKPETGSRMYRTGDLCRWLPGGNIQYLGRLDYQVKLRGFRIELGEIEATLDKHPAVQRSVAVVREDERGAPRLVAYVVLQPGETLNLETLQQYVRQSLPDFMTPSLMVEMKQFPLTANGKISRKELPAPDYAGAAGDYVAPRTPVERELAAIWSEVLHVERIGARDDFFALGGHSLLATRVISRVRLAMEADLPLRAIFETPKLETLAARIAGMTRSRQLIPIPRTPRNVPLPLSFAQERLWFLDQLDPGNPQYNAPLTMRLKGPLNRGAICAAVNGIIGRHDVLRTTFALHEDRPVQVIAPELRIELPRVDLELLPEADREAEAKRLVIEEARQPLHLESGPLVRALLLRLSEQDHMLLLNIHHIVTDGWSVWPLMRELATLYEACVAGEPAPLPELPTQYADHAVWQRELIESGALAGQLAYWKKQLIGAPAQIELLTDRARPAVQRHRGGTDTVLYPKDLLNNLQVLGQREGATLYMTLLAAYQTLLYRYTGQENTVVGSPIANRTRAEVEELIGLFVNTLVMHSDLSGNPTFRELLQRVRGVALGAFANQDLPFEKLVEAIAPDRDLSSSPLVQILFALQNVPRSVPKLAGVEFQAMRIHNGTSKFDIAMFLTETPDGLSCTVEYSTDLFEGATISRMLRQFGVLLEAIVREPEQRIGELPLLTAADRRQILFDWNATGREYPLELCVNQLFERQAARTPDRTAITAGARSLSYAELNVRANQVAHHLLRHGAGSGVLIGIRMTRSVDMAAALLGILKSGAAYVPLDPDFPADRIAFILEDSAARLVLTDDDRPRFDEQPCHNPASSVQPGDLAYVLHTSGSTGRPKGVQITHRNVVNFLAGMQREPGLTADDVLLAVTTLSFDIAGLELYLPLVSGAAVAIASREEAMDGNCLLQLMRQYRPTVLQATPATWRMLLDAGWSGSPQLKALCGGEALPADLAARLLPRCGELWNMYGPTETTIWSSVHRLRSVPAGTAPLGRPIANTTMYVLDQHMQPVPPGVPGELYIGGDGVARGYLNRPDLTAERFLDDPFVPGARIYRTGDLAKFHPDGEVQYLGRTDFQVKIRGFRIELGEIETVLAQHPAVRECVAAVRDERLIAYVVANHPVPAAGLRAWMKTGLPEYMLPAAFIELDRLPLTPNGKVDRKALPSPEYRKPDAEHAWAAPRTPAEEVIAGIWAEVLKIDRPGMDDNFFEAGGHSLSATQVVARVRGVFGVELPVRALFEEPTIAALARTVERLERANLGLPAPPLVRASRDKALPLSFAQQRLWFLDRMEPENPLYNIPWATRMTGDVNVEALEKALSGIVRRHEILRTIYRVEQDEPVQAVLPETNIPLAIKDLSALPAAAREHAARRLLQEESAKPFHLASDIVFRAMLVKLDARDHVLFVNTHHIASDGWSLGVIQSDLASLYEAALTGEAPVLPELSIQYADYAVWQRNWLQGEILERQLAYWRNQLDGAPPVLLLPADRPRQAVQSFRGAMERASISKALTGRIGLLSRQQGGTPFMTMLAAFQTVILHYTKQPDVVLGTDLAGRTSVETEALIGFFVNLMVVRTDLSQDPTFSELLGRVREVTLGAYAHQDVPFDKLVQELQPERSMSWNPLVQVLFVHQNTPRSSRPLPGIEVSGFPLDLPSKFDLAVFCRDTGAGVAGSWVYNPDLFDAETIAGMAAHYQTVLEKVTANPVLRLSEIHQSLAENEQRQRATEHKDFQEASLAKLKRLKRRAADGLQQ